MTSSSPKKILPLVGFSRPQIRFSAVCLAFVSDNSLASQNCRREINFALSRNQIGFLSVMLEDAKMSPGVELQLSTYQSLLMYRYSDKDEFYNKLSSVDLLEIGRAHG